ncbi:MAG: V-type ATP synthase subunit D [Candidatus Lokiarchaeota archaeon]|nr:V-type ATP synthase subunit D [Candidatus Lokiarchaeota archaeon]
MSFRAIKPTKTNLMNLQKRLRFAIKGEKFLELKREQLMDQIKHHWSDYKKSQDTFFHLYRESLIKLHQSYKEMGKRDLVLISEMSRIQYKPVVNIRQVKKLGMTISEIDFNLDTINKLPAYNFENSSHFLDNLILKGREFFDALIKFAEQEDIIINYALNFKKINRRINGLKNNIIPSLKLDIKLIREMIEEIDRENFVRLKKTKDLIKKNKIKMVG